MGPRETRPILAARRALGAAYVRFAPSAVRRRRGEITAERLDLTGLDMVRRAPLDRLQDAGYLERELIPALGLNDDMPHLFPAELQSALGHGVRAWQYPNQLAPYLAAVAAHAPRSYLEIGVQHGGTFVITVEYLRRFAAVEEALAVDLMRPPGVRRYARGKPDVRLLSTDSASRRFRDEVRRRRWGLVLIDGDHSETAVRRDWETVRDRADLIALHDIVDSYSPGVAVVWRELREREAGAFEFLEFTEQYPEVVARKGAPSLGIGLAIRRDGGGASRRQDRHFDAHSPA